MHGKRSKDMQSHKLAGSVIWEKTSKCLQMRGIFREWLLLSVDYNPSSRMITKVSVNDCARTYPHRAGTTSYLNRRGATRIRCKGALYPMVPPFSTNGRCQTGFFLLLIFNSHVQISFKRLSSPRKFRLPLLHKRFQRLVPIQRI